MCVSRQHVGSKETIPPIHWHGVVGSDKAQKVKGAEKSAPVATEKGEAVENLEAWGDWRTGALDDTSGVLSVNVRFYVNACYYLVLSISYENCATISSAKNFKISNGQTGLTRSAVFLICSLWCMPSGICTCSRDPDLVSRQTSSKSTCC